MSATAVPTTARGALTTRSQRPVTTKTRHYDRQGGQSCPPTTRRVQLATARVSLFLGVDQSAAAAQRQPGASATRQEVDGGG